MIPRDRGDSVALVHTRVSGLATRTLLVVTLAAGLSGCLSKPSPPGGETPDAGDTSCTQLETTPVPFVNGTTIFGTKPKVANLNADCYDDLIMTGKRSLGSPGVFIVFGRRDAFLSGFDIFLDLANSNIGGIEMIPLEVEVGDANGDSLDDILVVGAEAATNQAVVAVFLGNGAASFDNKPLIKRTDSAYTLGSASIGMHEPVYVMPARPSSETPDGVVFGSLHWGASFSVGATSWSQTGVDFADLVDISLSNQPFVQAMVRAPGGNPLTDGLFAISQSSTAWYAPAMGVFSLVNSGEIMSINGQRNVARANEPYGESQAVWSISGTELLFSGLRFDAAGTPKFTHIARAGESEFFTGTLSDLYATELVGDARKSEIVVLSSTSALAASLTVLVDIDGLPTQVVEQSSASHALPAGYRMLASGKFTNRDRPDVWVLPAIYALATAPLCMQLLVPDSIESEYCVVPCGSTGC